MLRLLVISILLFTASSALAQNNELSERLLANISQHEANIAENQEEIESYTEKKIKLEVKLEKALEALTAAKSAADIAEAQHGKDPSAENERTLKRAQDLQILAQRKVDSRKKRVDWIANKLVELNEDITQSENAITRNKARLNKLKLEQTAKAETKKLAAEAAVQSKSKSPAVVAPPAQAKPAPVEAISTPEPVSPNAKATEENNVAESASDDVDLDEEERNYIQKRMNSINEYLAGDPKKSANLIRLRGTSNLGVNLIFEHLGGEIYKAGAILKAGNHIVRINGSAYKVFVSKAHENQPYVFYFDARHKYKRKLLAFRENLLEPK